MTKQRLGILGGMGRPTRLAPCGDPDDLICSGQMNCPCAKVFASGENACTALATPPHLAMGFRWPTGLRRQKPF